MKVTTLTDTASLAVLDVQCHSRWRHDTKAGPQVVRRNADDLHTVAADNGFQDWHSEYEFYALGVEPLVHYRGSSLNAVTNNTLIRERHYTQRWMAETSYSSVKRSLGDAVQAQAWYREFREIVLMFAIHNIEQLCEPL
jgi:IS5 family transposase